jgi:hypothetical protein
MIKWHRLFGLTLKDYFTGTSYIVDLEKDLSIKQQLLDVVIIEKGEGAKPEEIPDGLENLSVHNLMTYKSHQQSLDGWTLNELIGHYVNYRKQISPSWNELLPDKEFQLYAVSARYPHNLLSVTDINKIEQGVYDIKWGDHWIRTIILSRVPKEKHNAIWQLFSADPERIQFGAINYEWRMPDISTIINDLFNNYKIEGIAMPYTIDDYKRDYVLEHIHKLPIEDRLKGLSRNDLIEALDKQLKNLSKSEKEELLKRLMES